MTKIASSDLYCMLLFASPFHCVSCLAHSTPQRAISVDEWQLPNSRY